MDDTLTSRRVTAIYVVGPSSTGKTTVCNALATQLGLPREVYITEVARTVMRDQGFTRDDVEKLEMQQAIMVAQLGHDARARQAAMSMAGAGIVLSDRSAVDAVVYAALTDTKDGGTMARTLIASQEMQATLPEYRHSVFILLHPVAEWMVDDGVRSLEDGWRCFKEFQRVLAQLAIPYVEVDGSCRWLEERVMLIRRYAWQ